MVAHGADGGILASAHVATQEFAVDGDLAGPRRWARSGIEGCGSL